MAQLVKSFEDVLDNIRTYGRSVNEFDELAARISKHPAWYALQDKERWIFGPSKFIGYRGAEAKAYLKSYNRRGGKETEPALAEWFKPVDLDSVLGRELLDSFRKFAEAYGKEPNSRWRVSVPIEFLEGGLGRSSQLDDRIAFNSKVCGGRAHIAGTRIRVSDIVAALAEGETPEDLLAEFSYLTMADITAALRYAAQAVDHRVLKAA